MRSHFTRNRTQRRAWGALVAGCFVLVATSACGSDSSESSPNDSVGAPTATEAADATGTTGASESTGDSAGVDEALARVAAATQRPTQIAVTTPLDAAIPADKNLVWIQCGAPACVLLGELLTEAAAEVGWSVDVIDAGLTPETIKAAYAQAIRDQPDAVTGSGFPRALFEEELQQLADLDIPFVGMAMPDPAGDGILASLAGEEFYTGQAGPLMADWVIADGGGSANTVFVTSDAYPVLGQEEVGFSSRYEELCGPDCGYDVLSVPADTIGTTLPERVVSYLRANPDVDYIAMGFADMALGLPGALRDAGLADQAQIVTSNSNSVVQQHIADGEIAMTVNLPNQEIQWRMIDVLIRHFQGADIDASTTVAVPLTEFMVVQDNLPDIAEPFPNVADYQAQFRELWGL